MKKRFLGALLSVLLICSMLTGCAQIKNAVESGVQSAMNEASSEIKSALKGESGKESSSKKESSASSRASGSYTMADVKKLKNTGHFAKNTLEHIFDGTINSKGKATGYHYDGISDSKGSIIAGTESKPDEHGVYTAKVEVDGVKKNGFSSFYPDDWTPQQVVDAINEAYDYATSSKGIRDGDLWIGYAGDLEINMYLNNSKQITTAYPIYEGD
ncbi:MAG: EndoU domain-containing protein [Ruminococcus sp.]|nr:EndoU domain-containing protein [Ruminococcus sp.]